MANIIVNTPGVHEIDTFSWNAGDQFLTYEDVTIRIATEPQYYNLPFISVLGQAIKTSTVVDARNVRHLDYISATGSISYGDVVTGGTSGATGIAIRTVGGTHIKFKSVTGAFVDGETITTSGGFSATTSGVDRLGCMLVTGASNAYLGGRSLGKVELRGEWFELQSTTDGSGSLSLGDYESAAYIPCLWIETSPGSGVYNKWLQAIRLTNLDITKMGNTGEFGNYFIHNSGDTSITFGDGTNGARPVSGCKVRVSNLIIATGDSTVTTDVDYGTAVASWCTINTTASPEFIMDKVSLSGCELIVSNASGVDIANSCWLGDADIVDSKSSISVDNCGYTPWPDPSDTENRSATLTVSEQANIAILNDLSSISYNGSNLTSNGNIEISNCNIKTRRSVPSINLSAGSYARIDNCLCYGGRVQISIFTDVEVNGLIYAPSVEATSSLNDNLGAVYLANGASGVILENISFDPNAAAYNNYIVYSTSSSNITIKNCGTQASPISEPILNFIFFNTNSKDIVVANCHTSGNTDDFARYADTANKCVLQNVSGSDGENNNAEGINSQIKGAQIIDNSITQQWVNHVAVGAVDSLTYDSFDPDGLNGLVGFRFNKQSLRNVWSINAGSPFFSDEGTLYMRTVGDQVIGEFDYFILGHEAFANVIPRFRRTGIITTPIDTNITVEYDLDTGSGYSGTWKVATGANLSAETLSPSTGFKIKVRLTTTAADDLNYMNALAFETTTTQASIDANHYPIRPVTYTLKLTGLKNPSEVRVYEAGTTTEVAGQENVTSGTFSYTYDPNDLNSNTVDIVIHSLNYQYQKIKDLDISTGSNTIPISQRVDRQYENL